MVIQFNLGCQKVTLDSVVNITQFQLHVTFIMRERSSTVSIILWWNVHLLNAFIISSIFLVQIENKFYMLICSWYVTIRK